MIPTHIKKYFWDADITEADIKKHVPYIIERILEYGDRQAVGWLLRTFKKSEIAQTLMTGRGFSPPSAHFWAVILGVPKNKILCLKKRFRVIRSKHWIW